SQRGERRPTGSADLEVGLQAERGAGGDRAPLDLEKTVQAAYPAAVPSRGCVVEGLAAQVGAGDEERSAEEMTNGDRRLAGLASPDGMDRRPAQERLGVVVGGGLEPRPSRELHLAAIPARRSGRV